MSWVETGPKTGRVEVVEGERKEGMVESPEVSPLGGGQDPWLGKGLRVNELVPHGESPG